MFITFEGGEGSGKSTQIDILYDYLNALNIPVYQTKDPGDTKAGNSIRKILLAKKYADMAKETELLLYLAARAELVQKNIQPALDAGMIVLCDRYFDSTAVYQGVLRGWNEIGEYSTSMQKMVSILDILHHHFSEDLIPDLTFLCDVSAKIGLKRSNDKLAGMQMDESKWESMGLQTHIKINQGFRDLANKNPDRFRFVDANQNPELMHVQIYEYLRSEGYIDKWLKPKS
jgi:dTMP kinase